MSQDLDTSDAGRVLAAEHMLDAIEQLTDDHVRAHAVPWRDVWVGGFGSPNYPTAVELVDRIDAAVKSLIVAKLELTTGHRMEPVAGVVGA